VSLPAQSSPEELDPQRRAAAFTAVRIAACEYLADPSGQRKTMAHLLARARRHGLTAVELRQASGLDEDFVSQLLEEAR